MSDLTLESLGFTTEELQDRVVERIVEMYVSEIGYDDSGNEYSRKSGFATKLKEAVNKRVDDAIEKIIDEHILPNAATYVESITLQATNMWGEKKGASVTFIEYLVQRAESYLTEKVNYQGKAKEEDSYSWSGTQTRITHLVHEHLHYSIEKAMKEALSVANKSIAGGIQEAVRIKLAEVTASLKVSVATK